MARLLVAGDDNNSRTLVCRMRTSVGHEVIVACDGKKALAACLHSPGPDVAVLDYRMPHLTELELTEVDSQSIPHGERRGHCPDRVHAPGWARAFTKTT